MTQNGNGNGGPWGGGPGARGPENPWGRGGGSGGDDDNDIDEMIDKFQGRIRGMMQNGSKGGGGMSGRFIFLVVGILCLLYLSTGFFRVEEGELAVVLRFGKSERIVSPGLHYHVPAPVESKIIRKVAAVNRIDGGSGDGASSSQILDQTLILTGDEQMVHTNYTILWKIKDIEKYLFTTRNPDETIRIVAESCLREIFGQTTARLALTKGRDAISEGTRALLQGLLDSYDMGIYIIAVQLQRVEPPAQVLEAYLDVQASLVDASRMEKEAEAYKNDIVPRARGAGKAIVEDAKAERDRLIAISEGEAAFFTAILESYQASPDVVLSREYYNHMKSVLENTSVMLVDGALGKNAMAYLPLNELQKGQKRAHGSDASNSEAAR